MGQIRARSERVPLEISVAEVFRLVAAELPKKQYDDAITGIGRIEERMPCVFWYSREKEVNHLVEFFRFAPRPRKSDKSTVNEGVIKEWMRDEKVLLDEGYFSVFARFIIHVMQYQEEDLYRLTPDVFKEIKGFVIGVRNNAKQQCP